MPILSEKPEPHAVTILQYSAAFHLLSAFLGESSFCRQRRQEHVAAQAHGLGLHAHFRFEHCPSPQCGAARGDLREPGEEG